MYTDSKGPDPTAEAKVLNQIMELAATIPGTSRIVFVSHTKGNTGWLTRWFGMGSEKKFLTGITMPGTSVPAKFESLNTYRSEKNEILVVLGLKSDDVLKLEDNCEAAAILGLPWVPGDLEKWARITSAQELLSGNFAASYSTPNCLVCQALTELSESINMSTGIHHPSDEEQCKTYLRALHGDGIVLDEAQIEAYLFKDLDWRKENLNDVIEIIHKINTGKTFHGGAKTGHQRDLDRWRKSCV